MNSVSWMIYLAGLSGNLSAVLTAIGLASMAGCIALLIYGGSMKECQPVKDPRWMKGHGLQKLAIKCTGVPITLFLVAAILPSTDTVYAIAVSEFGEEALHTDMADKASQALNAWLDRQIEGEKK